MPVTRLPTPEGCFTIPLPSSPRALLPAPVACRAARWPLCRPARSSPRRAGPAAGPAAGTPRCRARPGRRGPAARPRRPAPHGTYAAEAVASSRAPPAAVTRSRTVTESNAGASGQGSVSSTRRPGGSSTGSGRAGRSQQRAEHPVRAHGQPRRAGRVLPRLTRAYRMVRPRHLTSSTVSAASVGPPTRSRTAYAPLRRPRPTIAHGMSPRRGRPATASPRHGRGANGTSGAAVRAGTGRPWSAREPRATARRRAVGPRSRTVSGARAGLVTESRSWSTVLGGALQVDVRPGVPAAAPGPPRAGPSSPHRRRPPPEVRRRAAARTAGRRAGVRTGSTAGVRTGSSAALGGRLDADGRGVQPVAPLSAPGQPEHSGRPGQQHRAAEGAERHRGVQRAGLRQLATAGVRLRSGRAARRTARRPPPVPRAVTSSSSERPGAVARACRSWSYRAP